MRELSLKDKAELQMILAGVTLESQGKFINEKGRAFCECCWVFEGKKKIADWIILARHKDGTEEMLYRCNDHQEDVENEKEITIVNMWEGDSFD